MNSQVVRPTTFGSLAKYLRIAYALFRQHFADLGDVHFNQIFDVKASHADITNFYERLYKSGIVPLSAGGDHSITLPILRAFAADHPAGLVHIDAHTDCCDEEMNSKYTHGTPFRGAVKVGVLDPKRTIQIGIRGSANTYEYW